jgi:excisionase family DNA binding protein
MQDISERWLTTKEVAKILHISASTLAKRRLKGLAPRFAKFGRSVRYSLSAVHEYAHVSGRTSTSQVGKSL